MPRQPEVSGVKTGSIVMPDFAQVLNEDYKHYCLHGGRGGGKSWAVARHLLIEGAKRPLRILCGREHQKSISDSVKQLLDDQIIELGLEGHYSSTEDEITGRFHDTSFRFVGVWRNPRGLKSAEGVDIFWGEEAAAFSDRSIRTLIPTLRKEGCKFIWTWNPEYPHYAIEKRFRNTEPGWRLPPRTVVRKVTWRDNFWFPEDLREEMEVDFANDPDMAEHIWEGEYIKSVEGAYFAKELRLARDGGRFTTMERDPAFEVRAYWDLGRRDATAVWIVQFVGERVHVIDYTEGSGQVPGYYLNWLRQNGYDKCRIVLPHDGASVHPDNPVAMSYEAQFKQAGFPVDVIRNQGPAAAQQRIDAIRRVFPRLWFNEDATLVGVRALGYYHEKISEDERKARMGPEHDWSSHAADAFGLMAISFKEPAKKIETASKPKRKSQWAL